MRRELNSLLPEAATVFGLLSKTVKKNGPLEQAGRQANPTQMAG